jgi:trimeric autotransporter adhesin
VGIQLDHNNTAAGNQGGGVITFTNNSAKEAVIRFDNQLIASINTLEIANQTGSGPILFATQGDPVGGYGGNERMRITSAGLVGIGTAAPSAQLTVTTSAATIGEIIQGDPAQLTGLLRIQNSSGTELFSVTSTGSITSAGTFAFNGSGTSTIADALTVQGNALVVQQGSGNVGIGKLSPGSPTAPLQVAAGGGMNAVLVTNNIGTNATALHINSDASGELDAYTGTGGYLGGIYGSGEVRQAAGNIIGWALGNNLSIAPDIGISRFAANKLAIGNGTPGNTSGTLLAGQVGIGTNAPTAALTVTTTAATIGEIIQGGVGQTAPSLSIRNSAGTELFSVTSTGSVTSAGSFAFNGTGTNNIGGGLTVAGNISSPGTGSNSEKFGAGSSAAGASSIAIGNSASSTAGTAIVIGANSGVSGNASQWTIIGANNIINAGASGGNGILIGNNLTWNGIGNYSNSVLMGDMAAGAASAVVIGQGASGHNASVVIGSTATSAGDSIVIGYSAKSNYSHSVILGEGTLNNSGNQGIVIGDSASLTGQVGTVIGGSALVQGAGSVAIGQNAATYAANTFVAGSENWPLIECCII